MSQVKISWKKKNIKGDSLVNILTISGSWQAKIMFLLSFPHGLGMTGDQTLGSRHSLPLTCIPGLETSPAKLNGARIRLSQGGSGTQNPRERTVYWEPGKSQSGAWLPVSGSVRSLGYNDTLCETGLLLIKPTTVGPPKSKRLKGSRGDWQVSLFAHFICSGLLLYVHMWGSEDDFQESVLSLHPGDWIQVVWLDLTRFRAILPAVFACC